MRLTEKRRFVREYLLAKQALEHWVKRPDLCVCKECQEVSGE